MCYKDKSVFPIKFFVGDDVLTGHSQRQLFKLEKKLSCIRNPFIHPSIYYLSIHYHYQLPLSITNGHRNYLRIYQESSFMNSSSHVHLQSLQTFYIVQKDPIDRSINEVSRPNER